MLLDHGRESGTGLSWLTACAWRWERGVKRKRSLVWTMEPVDRRRQAPMRPRGRMSRADSILGLVWFVF